MRIRVGIDCLGADRSTAAPAAGRRCRHRRAALFECRGQGRTVDERASRGVDEEGVGLHKCELAAPISAARRVGDGQCSETMSAVASNSSSGSRPAQRRTRARADDNAHAEGFGDVRHAAPSVPQPMTPKSVPCSSRIGCAAPPAFLARPGSVGGRAVHYSGRCVRLRIIPTRAGPRSRCSSHARCRLRFRALARRSSRRCWCRWRRVR